MFCLKGKGMLNRIFLGKDALLSYFLQNTAILCPFSFQQISISQEDTCNVQCFCRAMFTLYHRKVFQTPMDTSLKRTLEGLLLPLLCTMTSSWNMLCKYKPNLSSYTEVFGSNLSSLFSCKEETHIKPEAVACSVTSQSKVASNVIFRSGHLSK